MCKFSTLNFSSILGCILNIGLRLRSFNLGFFCILGWLHPSHKGIQLLMIYNTFRHCFKKSNPITDVAVTPPLRDLLCSFLCKSHCKQWTTTWSKKSYTKHSVTFYRRIYCRKSTTDGPKATWLNHEWYTLAHDLSDVVSKKVHYWYGKSFMLSLTGYLMIPSVCTCLQWDLLQKPERKIP